VALVAAAALPLPAAAATETHLVRTGPIEVAGYEVKQGVMEAPHPKLDGHVTKMEVDLVDGDGKAVPIQRLMLHHIVFVNLSRRDATCSQFLGFDGQPGYLGLAPERFYAAGEERAKLLLPNGYGYRSRPNDPWFLTYMVMNHRQAPDQAYVEYKITTDDDPQMKSVDPYWLDVENCKSDPIYNVPGTGRKGSTHTRSADFTFPEAGRIIAGGGHTHGGARRLTVTQPECGNREVGRSVPTWGGPDHDFYNVKPILHEPGPVSMSGFGTETGIPVAAGQTIRLNSQYENSRPHPRVMGIKMVYFVRDASVSDGCGPLPSDMQSLAMPGRHAPVPFEVPLTGLNEKGRAVSIKAPPGKLERMRKGGTVQVGDRFFSHPNLEVKKGARLDWQFEGSELHNLTLANGPVAIGSPNLDQGRTYSRRLTKAGTYRFFCGLHPVDMQERVVVKPKKRK
jgi:plastocyanin